MADRSHGRSEGQEYVLLKHIGYGLVAIGGDDGVEHEYFEFEVVVGGQVAGHEGVYVGNGVAVAVDSLVALVDLEVEELEEIRP